MVFDVLLMFYWWLIDGFWCLFDVLLMAYWWFLMFVWWVLMDFYGCLLVRRYKVTNNIPFVQVFSRLLAENDRKKCVFRLKTASWSTLAPLEHPSSTLLFLWISVLKHQKVLKCCNLLFHFTREICYVHCRDIPPCMSEMHAAPDGHTFTVGTYPRVCPKYTHPPMDIHGGMSLQSMWRPK